MVIKSGRAAAPTHWTDSSEPGIALSITKACVILHVACTLGWNASHSAAIALFAEDMRVASARAAVVYPTVRAG